MRGRASTPMPSPALPLGLLEILTPALLSLWEYGGQWTTSTVVLVQCATSLFLVTTTTCYRSFAL